jgi:hypothetical protein
MDDLAFLPTGLPGGPEEITIGAVTDLCLAQLEPAEAFGMSGQRTAVRVLAAKFPAIAAGQAVTFRSTSYTVKDTPNLVGPDNAWLIVDLERT